MPPQIPEVLGEDINNTYIEEVPEGIKPFRDLLKSYSGIPDAEVDSHLKQIVGLRNI